MYSDFQGQCHLVLEMKDFSLEQLKIINEKSLKASLWMLEIKRINGGEYTEWLPKKKFKVDMQVKTSLMEEKDQEDREDLMSPRLVGEFGGILCSMPNLSFDESSQGEEGSSPMGNMDWKRTVEDRFAKIKMKWSMSFCRH
jgi:hypothetical protein